MMTMTWKLCRTTILTRKRCKELSKKTKCTPLRMRKMIKKSRMMMMRTWKMKTWKKSKKRMKT